MGRGTIRVMGEAQSNIEVHHAREGSRVVFPTVVGGIATTALLAFYVLLVGSLQGFSHVRELLWQDRFFVLTISLAFGVQWGLFVQLWRARHARAMGSSAAVASSGTGASAISMVACCLHHATDVLPVLGISGAAVFLAQYRTPFLISALAMNLGGVVWILYSLRRVRNQTCHVTSGNE